MSQNEGRQKEVDHSFSFLVMVTYLLLFGPSFAKLSLPDSICRTPFSDSVQEVLVPLLKLDFGEFLDFGSRLNPATIKLLCLLS